MQRLQTQVESQEKDIAALREEKAQAEELLEIERVRVSPFAARGRRSD